MMDSTGDQFVQWRRNSNVSNNSPTGSQRQKFPPLSPQGQRSIYRAPQASIRTDRGKDSKSSGGTRRRRRDAKASSYDCGPLPPPPPPPMTESSDDPYAGWNVEANDLDQSISERNENNYWNHSSPAGHYRRRPLVLRQSHEDFSASHNDDNDSYTQNTFYSTDSYAPTRKRLSLYRWLNTQSIMQFVVLVFFGMIIYDSHHRSQQHKLQLEQYDDERAHILEQMMWIDKAAKKAHKKYAQKAIWDDINDEKLAGEKKDELVEEAEGLRDAMKKLQLRVQLNARGRVQKRFGQQPMEVSISLDKAGEHKLLIALTDDTPHAASIFLEQIENSMWDTVKIQRLESGTLQLSTDQAETTPVLEFVESSHSCREAGSVVFRQLEADSMDLTVAVLRVHMSDNIPISELDVCIGKIKQGFEHLKSTTAELPLIKSNP